ncbi:dihydrodipicolinate synthase family protein [Microlunatus sp. Y2014]|uniref:dihydrodipicolinate synthase family protein n=1 Tax=Microlunatus sp. Y2014 TaxID=3418488 RepID=UPI003DA75B9E
MSPTHRRPIPRTGVLVPMVTPLLPTGEVDVESTASFVAALARDGVAGVLVLGSSGENAALPAAQRRTAVEAVVAAGQQVHVMAGVAALGTADAVNDAREFAALGADSILASAPFGFQLSQDELTGHFTSLAGASDAPVVGYEVPSRVGVSLSTALLVRLLGDGVLAGVKDSSGNIGGARLRSEALAAAGLTDTAHFTGSEECIDAFLLGGGTGCIPGLANVFAPLHVDLCRRAAAGDWAGASQAQGRIAGLLDLYFNELPGASFSAQFFAIVKEALVQQGIIAHNTTAAPFVQADAGTSSHVTRMLERARDLHGVVERTSTTESEAS